MLQNTEYHSSSPIVIISECSTTTTSHRWVWPSNQRNLSELVQRADVLAQSDPDLLPHQVAFEEAALPEAPKMNATIVLIGKIIFLLILVYLILELF